MHKFAKMKIAVLLSGGVDSSVALRLLLESGQHDVTAFYLKIWLEDEVAFLGECPWEEDLMYCRAVCEQAGVPLEVVSLQQEYQQKIVDYALAELRAGRTPSSDILCNQRIKFGEFDHKIDTSFDKIASGHYANISFDGNAYFLKKSPDSVKDQTYFLSHLSQRQLRKALFPLGPYTKREVRAFAQRFDLPNQVRKDSQGICFLGKISYPQFVKFHLGEQAGDIVEIETGRVLGQHNGYWFHTIGQRQGLGLGNGPWFVVRKDIKENRLYVSHRENLTNHIRSAFEVGDVHWISEPPKRSELQIKIRHAPECFACTIQACPDGKLAVNMAAAETGIAAGQFAVFYDGDTCLGGGMIVR